jgi:hypothetical protein
MCVDVPLRQHAQTIPATQIQNIAMTEVAFQFFVLTLVIVCFYVKNVLRLGNRARQIHGRCSRSINETNLKSGIVYKMPIPQRQGTWIVYIRVCACLHLVTKGGALQ